jgi:hypothetical protein
VQREPERCREFASALGREIVKQGHVLLNGCKSDLDTEVALAAQRWLADNDGNPEEQIVSYCLKSQDRAHAYGRVRFSALPDWQMIHPELRMPEQIDLAHVTIFVGGNQGTFWAKNWAYWARKPILGVPRFGGAGDTIYEQELRRRQAISDAEREEYETLNQLAAAIPQYAKDVVDLAERLVMPRSVFPVLSYKNELRDVSGTYQEVCSEFGFTAERIDESHSLERILPRIETGIRQSAFVIADVTEPSPNVFYELGLAQGMGKEVIVTARTGTTLPFDVGDVPVIFWDYQADLKTGLRQRLAARLKGKR